jgi:hypothetical protein
MGKVVIGDLMRELRVLGTLAIVLVALAGSGAYGPSAKSGFALASTRFTSSALPDTTTVTLGLPGIFTGEGSKVLSIWIEPGVWIFRTAYMGNTDFVATLRNREAQYTRDLSQEAGAEPQLAWVSITRAGLYSLEIITEGPWTIEAKGCTCAAESG